MSRTRFKIYAVMGLVALVVLVATELEPPLFKSLNLIAIQGGAVGVVTGVLFVFSLLVWGELEIIDKEQKD